MKNSSKPSAACAAAPPIGSPPALRKALADRVNLVAAKAANIAAELPAPEILPDLLRAFDRLFEDPVETGSAMLGEERHRPGAQRSGPSRVAAFLRGAAHVQMEPVWGGQEDTAGPLRGICLLALPACPDLAREQVLRHMVNALTEPSPTVRADAARALAEMQGDDCALLLRLKARAGDAEAAVTGQVLESLLALERRAALPFVRQFLAAGDQVAEEAALALGGSRQSDAVDVLLESWPAARGLGVPPGAAPRAQHLAPRSSHRIPERQLVGGGAAPGRRRRACGAGVVPGEGCSGSTGSGGLTERRLEAIDAKSDLCGVIDSTGVPKVDRPHLAIPEDLMQQTGADGLAGVVGTTVYAHPGGGENDGCL